MFVNLGPELGPSINFFQENLWELAQQYLF